MWKKGGRHFSWDECKSRINQPRLRCCVREGRSRSMILVLMSGNNHAVDYIILLQRITLEDRTEESICIIHGELNFLQKKRERERERRNKKRIKLIDTNILDTKSFHEKLTINNRTKKKEKKNKRQLSFSLTFDKSIFPLRRRDCESKNISKISRFSGKIRRHATI